MMATLKAFVLGMREFRLTYTTHYANPRLASAYDWGREVAHVLTMRRYEA